MLDQETKTALREAFLKGRLQVSSATSPDQTHLCTIKDVMRHETLHKKMVKVTLEDGRTVQCTEDHSLILPDLAPCHAASLKKGSEILALNAEGALEASIVASVVFLPNRYYTYDLCVPGPENFVLTSGIVAHNSYSIGGISLDISKASQYESLKGNAESQLDKMLEAKSRTVKVIRGLQQSRFGVGVRSALGPQLGSGVVSPAKYVGIGS